MIKLIRVIRFIRVIRVIKVSKVIRVIKMFATNSSCRLLNTIDSLKIEDVCVHLLEL